MVDFSNTIHMCTRPLIPSYLVVTVQLVLVLNWEEYLVLLHEGYCSWGWAAPCRGVWVFLKDKLAGIRVQEMSS